eukprot:6818890-Ditylum_brightwellii.AAC.1
MPLLGKTNNQQQNDSSSSGEEEGEEEMESADREAFPSPCQMAHVSQPGQLRQYQKVLCKLMMFVNNTSYPVGHVFSDQELLRLKPQDVYEWMCCKVYGKENPSPEDNPTCGCSSSLEYYKKAISFFMPCQLEAWNVTIKLSNPSRSVDVYDLTKAVKKKEVCQQGKDSSADCPFKEE